MASKRRVRRRQCEGKRKYCCLAEANQAADRSRRATHDHIASYRCGFCGQWHIGHRSARKLLFAGDVKGWNRPGTK